MVPQFIDMPTTTEIVSGKEKEVVDISQLGDILAEYSLEEDLTITVEHIWDWASADGDNNGRFYFIRDYGGLLGVLKTLKLSFLKAAPKAWQGAHKKPKCPMPPEPPEHIVEEEKRWRWRKNWKYNWNKQWSIETHQKRFPTANLILPRCRTPHDGRSDAGLIADYAAMKAYMETYKVSRRKK